MEVNSLEIHVIANVIQLVKAHDQLKLLAYNTFPQKFVFIVSSSHIKKVF